MTERDAFLAGWQAGHYDGGDHDCRMFEPTAARAYERFKHNEAFDKLSLKERVASGRYRCTGCLGPVTLNGTKVVCVQGCAYGNQWQPPA